MNTNEIIETLKGLEIIQEWLTDNAKITNINLEEYTMTMHDVEESEPITRSISEIAKHFAKMTEDIIIEKIHDDKIPQTTLCDVINNFREELKILRKLIK
jgi:malate synthase